MPLIRLKLPNPSKPGLYTSAKEKQPNEYDFIPEFLAHHPNRHEDRHILFKGVFFGRCEGVRRSGISVR
jgi:hypothetical protein